MQIIRVLYDISSASKYVTVLEMCKENKVDRRKELGVGNTHIHIGMEFVKITQSCWLLVFLGNYSPASISTSFWLPLLVVMGGNPLVSCLGRQGGASQISSKRGSARCNLGIGGGYQTGICMGICISWCQSVGLGLHLLAFTQLRHRQ